MGLEEIVEKIDSDTEAKVKQILDSARSQASKITDEAKAKAKQQEKDAKARAENEAKQIVARELSRAQVEAAQQYQKELSGAVDEAITMMKSGLEGFSSSQSYQKLLAKLASKAAGELGDGCTIYVNKKDAAKLAASGKFNIEEANDLSGGLRGVSKDQSMYVDYTLERILSNISDRVAIEVLKLVKE